MKLSVKNIGPIRAAEIDIEGLTLLVGRNEAGKSTLCSALGALLKTGSAAFAKHKKGLKAAVADGEDSGVCLLTNGTDWEARMVLPDGDRTEKNAPQAPKVTDISLGVPFAALKPDDRTKVLQTALGVRVNGKDITDALAKEPIGLSGEPAMDVLARLKDLGWDALERRYREDSTKKKGAWEAVTGTRYGSDKAGAWMPQGMTETIRDGRLEDLINRAETAGKTLDALKAANVVSAHDHEALEVAAAKLPAALTAEAAAHIAHENAQRAVDEKRAVLSTLPDPSAGAGVPCPHCGGPIKIDTTERHAIKLVALPKTTDLNTRELQDLRMKRAGIMGEIENLESAKIGTWNTFVEASAAVKAAKNAKERLEKGGNTTSEETLAEIQRAEQESGTAKAALGLRQTHDKAQGLHRDAVVNLAIADLLAPSGLRQKAMDARIADFNSELARLSQGAGMDDPVAIAPVTLDVSRGTRPYERLSRGARFAVDIVLQLGLAKRSRDSVIVIDDFEALVGQHRSGIIKIIAASQIPALLAVAASEVGKLQNVVNAGIGRVYQVEGGATREIVRSEA